MSKVNAISFVLAALCTCVSSQAALVWDFGNPNSISIADLNANYGGAIQVGDKLFDNFSTSTHASGVTLVPDETSTNITGYEFNGEFGLVFAAPWQVEPGQSLIQTLQFRVTALNPNQLIHDNTLGLISVGNSTESGNVIVSETIFENKVAGEGGDVSQQPLAVSLAFFVSIAENKLSDHQIFVDPDTENEVALPSVWVVKDIALSGGQEGSGIAALSGVVQTFSQIPEPGSMGMLLMMAGTGVMGRRRR